MRNRQATADRRWGCMIHGLRNLLWLVPLLLVLGWPVYGGRLAALLAPPEVPESEEIRERYREDERQQFTMDSVRFIQEVDGQLRWLTESRQLRTGASEDELLLSGVDATFFRDGEEQVWISAGEGRYDTTTGVLDLEVDVRLRDADGLLLETQALSYHEAEGRVSSRAGVVVTDDELRVRGQNLDYFMDDGSYDLTGDVEVLAP